MARTNYEVRRLAPDLLVFLRRNLNVICAARVGTLAEKLEIPRCLFHIRGLEAEGRLLDALVHFAEERFICCESGGVQEPDVTTARVSSLPH